MSETQTAQQAILNAAQHAFTAAMLEQYEGQHDAVFDKFRQTITTVLDLVAVEGAARTLKQHTHGCGHTWMVSDAPIHNEPCEALIKAEAEAKHLRTELGL
jgi:hypothetical protein